MKLINDAEGNIIDDDGLVEQLTSFHRTRVQLRQREDDNRRMIQESRKQWDRYRPIADRISTLYFTILEM